MNRTKRKQLVKKYRIYLLLAFSTIIIFILGFIALMVFNTPQPLRIIGGITIIIGLFLALIFNVLADWTHRDLLRFKADVKEYRTRRFFLKCLDLIEAGKLQEACDVYNDYIPIKHDTRSYLYSVLLHELSKSNDPELKKRGISRLIELRKFYNPNNVVFN